MKLEPRYLGCYGKGRFFNRLLGLLSVLALPAGAPAHQLDEYLQATLVAVKPGEIRLLINLTPGVAVAEKIVGLIDRNHDGTISTNESAAYAEVLKRDLIVRLDERTIELKLAAAYFPDPDILRSGWGIIQVQFTAQPGLLVVGPHKLSLQNRHLTALSAYLLNAAQTDSAVIEVTAQKRNKNQSRGEIAFEFHPVRK